MPPASDYPSSQGQQLSETLFPHPEQVEVNGYGVGQRKPKARRKHESRRETGRGGRVPSVDPQEMYVT